MRNTPSIQIKTLQIVAAPEGTPPFKVEAFTYEQDTFLVLSAANVIKDSDSHPKQLAAQAHEIQSATPGSVIVRGKSPLKLLAIVHDFNEEPSWKEEWIESALQAIFQETESRKLESVALPLLGSVYGSLEESRFFSLLRSVIEHTPLIHLKHVWLVIPAGMNCLPYFEILKGHSLGKDASKGYVEELELERSPEGHLIPKRQLAAIMFTDIVGYSKLMEENETVAYLRLMSHHEIIRANIVKYHGREIKTIGDAFLVMFSSAVDAVDCALTIQMELLEYNRNKAYADKILVRIGIHLGDILMVENDILGDGVNVAARIEPLAEPGGICISEAVYNIVKKKMSISVENLGTQPLKNITESQNIYKLTITANKD